jgi:hypothetical protein
MIALTLVRVIERHSGELAAELVTKLGISPRTTDLRKVPVEELRRHIEEILQHLTEWLLTKTGRDIEQHFFELGERRASQGVTLSDFCWAIAVIKDISGNFWSGRASNADRLKFAARSNCCACWTSFLIALYALRPRAMSSPSSCRTILRVASVLAGSDWARATLLFRRCRAGLLWKAVWFFVGMVRAPAAIRAHDLGILLGHFV